MPHSVNPRPSGGNRNQPGKQPAVTIPRAATWGGAALVLVVGAALSIVIPSGCSNHPATGSHAHSKNGSDPNELPGLPVNTVHPHEKTLERILVQPGSIKPMAQVELYAKAAGILKSIQRTPTPEMVADLVAQRTALSGAPLGGASQLATVVQLAMWQAPQIDIGSRVTVGDLLLAIDTPERIQDVVQKETQVEQREAELAAAETALATHEAAVEAAKALKVQAEADVRKTESECIFRTQELKRIKDLVSSRTVPQEIADEKQNQVNATVAAWDSSKAKVLTAQADISVVTSKLTAARADLKVKAVLVQVAKDELRRAQVLEEDSRIYAPFNGIITHRGVDEGDFVQNASSGQTRRLMTITALEKVRVVLQVPERDAPWVQVGTEATIVVDARTGRKVEGRVARTANALDPQTRTLNAEIDLDNRDRLLLPEMYGQVTLVLQRIPKAQAIPATALFSRKGENFIILAEKGVARQQKVRVRFDDGREVEVVQLIDGKEVPLDGSEELIVSNKGEIAEGQRVKPTLLNSD